MSLEFWTSESDRKTKLRSINARGDYCTHQDFIDINGRKTNGKTGRLTIQSSQPIVDKTEMEESKALKNKIVRDTATLTDVNNYLSLNF